MECSPERGSDKKKHPKESKLYLTAWTPIWIEALRQVDLEPNGKRGANRTRALVSFYWSSWSLHPKEPPNQISHNSTRVDPIRLSPICLTESQNPLLFSISKQSFQKLPRQLMPMTEVISWSVTPKDKTKSNPLAREKVSIFSKSAVSF